jgi:hypothetical protein
MDRYARGWQDNLNIVTDLRGANSRRAARALSGANERARAGMARLHLAFSGGAFRYVKLSGI